MRRRKRRGREKAKGSRASMRARESVESVGQSAENHHLRDDQ